MKMIFKIWFFNVSFFFCFSFELLYKSKLVKDLLTFRSWSRRDVRGQDPLLLDQVLPELEDDEPAKE